MTGQAQSIATLFSLINPAMCALIFAGIASGLSAKNKAILAIKSMLTVALVLTGAAFLGSPILSVFGISLDVFSVAGGIVLAFIGFSMLAGSTSSSTPDVTNAPDTDSARSPARLVMFAASPGTITGVITSVAAHSDGPIPFVTIIAILVVVAATLLLLLATSRTAGSSDSKPSLARDMTTRYMGLIVIAMGIQFALSGYKAFMAG
jgi:multiple antibiotic resistance protein